jgi:protein gp37
LRNHGDGCHPLPNVWLGTSCEDQETANTRIPLLLDTPAAVRFVSAEPLLGPISYIQAQMLDWIIVGGESGPHARPMHPDWARGIRDQCILGGAKFFMKQWGEWIDQDVRTSAIGRKPNAGHDHELPPTPIDELGPHMWRVGKKEAGRLLDGREWNEFPEGARA